MPTANPHVVIELTDGPDCRFFAAWFIKAAEAQTCWSQALNDPDFAKHVLLLYVDVIPDLAAGAAEIFGELEHCRGVLALDLFLDEGDHISREFGLLVRLGFFVYDDGLLSDQRPRSNARGSEAGSFRLAFYCRR